MRGLAGQIALVTGAGGPMGRAIAERLAADGVDLMLSDISGNRLAATVAALSNSQGASSRPLRIASLRADATAGPEAKAVAALAVETFGRVDILVNVVGGIKAPRLYTPFLEMSEAQWDSTLALNLKPGFHLIQALAPAMLARGKGAIVNIASIVMQGEGGQSDYASAKAAVAALTRTLAAEFAPHIRVNAIAPALIQTTVTDRLNETEIRNFIDRSVIRRLGQASEVADAVAFLASDESSFITAEILAVAGGNHPHL